MQGNVCLQANLWWWRSNKKVEEVFNTLLTERLQPDMLTEPARNRFVDGVILSSWIISKAN